MSVNIVRIKRKINEPSPDSVVLSYKKRRLHDENTTDKCIKEALEYAGTSTDQNADVTILVKKAVRKKKIEDDYKKHRLEDISHKTRQTTRKQSECQRFKIVSERRGIKVSDFKNDDSEDRTAEGAACSKAPKQEIGACMGASAVESDGKRYNVFDLEQEGDLKKKEPAEKQAGESLMCNGIPMISEKSTPPEQGEAQYVYDIFYLHTNTIDFRDLERDLQFECFRNEDIIWESQGDSDEELCYDDDDDENEEDNWRNDYPDEDAYGFYAADEEEREDYDAHVSRLMDSRLKITDSDDELSPASEDEDAYNHLWAPKTPYEVYKKRITRELYGSDEDDT